MRIQKVTIETGLEFLDVVEYIPTLTTENDVVTDGKIVKFEVLLGNGKMQHVFLDLATAEYCFKPTKYRLEVVGDLILSHYFKYSNITDFLNEENMEWLVLDILEEEV